MPGEDYYQLLNIEKSASREEIKKAYRTLALQYHPDINPEEDAEERIKKLNQHMRCCPIRSSGNSMMCTEQYPPALSLFSKRHRDLSAAAGEEAWDGVAAACGCGRNYCENARVCVTAVSVLVNERAVAPECCAWRS